MKFSLDKNIFDIPLNWALISAGAAFWCYGYFAAASFRAVSFTGNIFISVILYGAFLSLILLSRYCKKWYEDTLTIRAKDIVVFLSFLAIMLTLSFRDLTSPLVGDQIVHSQESQRHIITILLKLPAVTNILDNLIFSNVLFLLNLLSIGMLALLYYLFRNRNFATKVIWLSAGFFIFRIAVIMLGSYAAPHPPLRLFPLWLSSSLLSGTDFSFKLPQFLGLIALMWLAQRIANRRFTFLFSWLFGLAVGTIPLLWHVGTLVEQSIWTALVWSIFLLSAAENDDLGDFKWIRWSSLISLFTMMRQTAFLALMPLFIFYIAYAFHKDKYDLKKLFFVLAPVLVSLPFIMRSSVAGTPANYIPGEFTIIPQGASSIERVWFAVRSGIAPWIILNTVLLPWAIFPFFAFLVYFVDFKKILNAIVILIFFAAAFATFYIIRIGIWGTDRYQAEYIVPFAILGLYKLLVKLNGAGKTMPKLLAAGLICIVIYNVSTFKSLYSHYKVKQVYRGVAIQTQPLYNYTDALKAVRNEGYAGHTYTAGITYGVFPEILNGFTVAQVLSTKRMIDRQNEMKGLMKAGETGLSPGSINAAPEIKIVLISDIEQNVEELIKGLQAFGWKTWRDFKYDRSQTVIYGMIRGGR